MQRSYRVVLVLLCLVLFVWIEVCGFSRFALAEPATERCRVAIPLTLEAFRAIALEKSPLVAEIDTEYSRSVARAFDSEVLANPELQLEQAYTRMRLGGADDPQTNISLGQPLKLSNFGAKQRVSALLRKAGDTEKRAKLLALSQKLSAQFYSLVVMQKTERLLIEFEQSASRKIQMVHEGVKKGLLSEGEHRLFEGEKYRLQSQSKGIKSSISALQAELGRVAGLSCAIDAKSDLNMSAIPALESLIQQANDSGLSESTRAELMATLTSEQARLAELDSVPSITPRLVYQHTNDGGDFIGAGVALPLPFFNRNQGERSRVSAELIESRRKRDYLLNGGLTAQIEALRQAAVNAAEQARIYQQLAVPAFKDALKSQEMLYAEGKGSVVQVWQTLRTCNEAQRESLVVWLEAIQARIQLSLLVGEEV